MNPIKEGIDDSSCMSQQINDIDKRVTALENQISSFDLSEIETEIQDLCGNVAQLNAQSQGQYDQLQQQGNDASSMNVEQPPSDVDTGDNPDDTIASDN
jgi:septal ring factor EnvC (AmiA/AmiB activator)